ncbi:MAG: CxxxxCH/CxxCH domain-containing protein [Lachnospiraceae bacterium]|nr:CxxxxCH/CxxCH domain-containing protein [Lachnospiraceae bacterium]
MREKDFLERCRPFYCHASGTVQSVAQTGMDPVWAKGGKSEN